MPVSKKQLRANRANARKSTGPKSYEGKQMASRNGVKYGLYSQDIIITSTNLKENKEEYDRLLDSLLNEFQPQTGMQLYLVHKIANCLWRSRRAVRAETAVVTRQLDHIDRDVELRNRYLTVVHHMDGDGDDEYEMTPEEEEHFRAVEIGRQSIPHDTSAVNILRYEMRLDRQLTRAYKLLCQLQDRQSCNQAETDGREEIFVRVFKCPAEHGMECPRDPQRAAVSMENHDQVGRDAIESRPRGAGHRDPGGVETAEEGFERATVDAPMGEDGRAPARPYGLVDMQADESRGRGAGNRALCTPEGVRHPPRQGVGHQSGNDRVL
ncbi:MAG: hypothetical protein PHR28_05085 [candidate division Zixibacteria bacterium]|nr:hypothetical protein [candidate division Zixibacteria bacterium]